MRQSRAVKPMVALAALALLFGCIGAPHRQRPPPRADRVLDTPALRQCLARLDLGVARYRLLPDRDFGNGCSAKSAVQLLDIGTPVSSLGAMTCPLASSFAQWVQSDLQIPAMGEFGSPVVKVETFGSYACRNVNNAADARLSEHAFANAVDVSAFVLKDGTRIAVLGGWRGDERRARFLRAVRDAACRRFRTVLSPDYNALHEDHLHFDMGGSQLCR
ncbi:MAG TPA: extensin family protein [Sphingomonas sp.]|nr:extensin family protein [Sphingomonas sp.]